MEIPVNQQENAKILLMLMNPIVQKFSLMDFLVQVQIEDALVKIISKITVLIQIVQIKVVNTTNKIFVKL